jgi:hypothetical protein
MHAGNLRAVRNSCRHNGGRCLSTTLPVEVPDFDVAPLP